MILLTRDVLYRHDNEVALHDVAKRSRVASLYLPFVTIVMDVYDKLWKEFNKSTNNRTTSITDRSFDDDAVVRTFMKFFFHILGNIQEARPGTCAGTCTRTCFLDTAIFCSLLSSICIFHNFFGQ